MVFRHFRLIALHDVDTGPGFLAEDIPHMLLFVGSKTKVTVIINNLCLYFLRFIGPI